MGSLQRGLSLISQREHEENTKRTQTRAIMGLYGSWTQPILLTLITVIHSNLS